VTTTEQLTDRQEVTEAQSSRLPFRVSRLLPLLILAALAPFLLGLSGYFLSDDWVLLDWTHVSSLGDVAGFFDPNTFWFYRPLLKVYYWAGQALFGLHAAPYHAISILLHAANAYLLYRLVVRLSRRPIAGIAAALIFALVPHHAETVSWIAATGDLVAGACILSALLLFWRYLEQGKVLYLALSIAVFALGLFTRESTIMLPVLLVLSLIIFNPHEQEDSTNNTARVPLSRAFMSLAGYAVVLVVYFLVQFLGRTEGGSGLARGGLTFRSLNIESILLAIMEYVHGLLPGGTALAQLPLDTLRWLVWVEAALLALAAVTLWRSGLRLALFGLLWMLVTPLLFVFFSSPTDRYYYLPTMGFAMLLADLLTALPRLLSRGLSRLPDRAPTVISALLVAAVLLWQLPALLSKQSAWREAGLASGGVLNDTRAATADPNDYTAYFYVDLPTTLNGVPFFGNGLQQAVQLSYDNHTLTASATTCEALQQQAELPRYSVFLRFKGDGVEPLPDREACK
jgi:4-amino-4-deoxy-L-arabinose transferase-like glycosyltransferase